MLWKGRRESGNVIDQRSLGGTGKAMGGGALLIGAFFVYLMGGNPLTYITQNIDTMQPRTQVSEAQDSEKKSFVGVVLADTEDVWTPAFENISQNYRAPRLVLFRGSVESACGMGSAASGPFYCPADEQIYIDLSFFDDMSSKFGAAGDFAEAYVIAHEVGHHVQKLLGLTRGGRESNAASVEVELQADCLAGVWAKQNDSAKQVLERGDIEEALGAAAAVGDDHLQKITQGHVVPDSFTHGTSAQRAAAFKQGFNGGDLQACVR